MPTPTTTKALDPLFEPFSPNALDDWRVDDRTSPVAPKSPQSGTLDLASVASVVDVALYEYTRMAQQRKQPQLKVAELTFKTTIAKEQGIKLILLFTLSGGHENERTIGMSYKYEGSHFESNYTTPKLPDNLKATKDVLLNAITNAADGARVSVAGHPSTEFTVTLQYGVTWKGGVTSPDFVFVANAQASKSDVQTISLVFENH